MKDEIDDEIDEIDEIDDDEIDEDVIEKKQSTKIKQKYKTTPPSDGVDDIQKLPLNWFNNVRQQYTQNNIISKKQKKNKNN